ncbi:beta strand repeat-containing protein [Mucisphaera sp.]|uniref:beta strand repeat-containing protein n=1 Tax=Mucisphaera sp. TaxID=2913024 RepID=UPI003D0D07AF
MRGCCGTRIETRWLLAGLLVGGLGIGGTAGVAGGDVFEWTGAAGNTVWGDANNWLNLTAGGVVSGSPGALDSVEIPAGVAAVAGGGASGDMSIGAGGSFTLTINDLTMGGSLQNDGLFTFQNSGFSNTELLGVDGSLAISGSGEMVLNSNDARIGLVGGFGPLVNGGDHTIRGFGFIDLVVDNSGLLRAENGTLRLAATANSLGVVEIASGSTLSLTGVLDGGTLRGASGSLVEGVGVSGIRTEGVVSVGTGDLGVSGVVTNVGVLTYQGSGFSNLESLQLEDAVTLTGGGELVMNNGDARVVQGVGSAGLIQQNHTIRASAGNSGVIVADVDNIAGALVVDPGARLVLDGILTGGIVDVDATGVLDGGTLADFRNVDTLTVTTSDRRVRGTIENVGLITFQNSGFSNLEVLELDGPVRLEGGGDVVMTSNDARIAQVGAGGALVNVDNSITGLGTIAAELVNENVVIAEGGTLNLARTHNANGTIGIVAGSTLNLTDWVSGGLVSGQVGSRIQGVGLEDVELSGDVAITLGDLTVRGELVQTGTVTFEASGFSNLEALQLDGQVVLSGGGEILMNNGDARILQAGGTTGGLVNQGNVIRAAGPGNSGRIEVDVLNEGRVEVASGATLGLGGTISGGVVEVEPGGFLEGGLLEDVRLEGVLTVRTGDRRVAGTIENRGVITFENSGFSNLEALILEGEVTLWGGGVVELNNHEAVILQGAGTTGGLRNFWTSTIRGFGRIEVEVENSGGIEAAGGKLFANGDLVQPSATGSLEVRGGAELEFNGSLIRQNRVVIDAGGVFDFNGDRLEIREIRGTFEHDQGVLAPVSGGGQRGGPTSSRFDDYLQLDTDVVLELLLSDVLNHSNPIPLMTTDNLTLLGELRLLNDDFVAQLGMVYPIIEVEGVLSGTFAGLAEGAFVDRLGGADLFITYTAGDGNDIGLFTVPEPGMAGLLGLAGLGLVGRGGRRNR